MILVEAGEMLTGDTGFMSNNARSPQVSHRGRVNFAFPLKLTYSFEIGEIPVTSKEYKEFIDSDYNSNNLQTTFISILDKDCPADRIGFEAAASYCNWLSNKEKLPEAYSPQLDLLDAEGHPTWVIPDVVGYRLPTEAEWEYTARGGHLGDSQFRYPGSNNLFEVGWFYRNSGKAPFIKPGSINAIHQEDSIEYGLTPHGVGLKKPNKLGLYDMAGNIWEWCTDIILYEKLNCKEVVNPVEAAITKQRVPGDEYPSYTPRRARLLKGGSCTSFPEECLIPFTTWSYYITPQYGVPHNTGFRITRTRRCI